MNHRPDLPGSREREIFIAALDRTTAAERAAFLDEACGSDGKLRQRLSVLLEEHFKASNFMEDPVADLVTPFLLNEKAAEGVGAVVGQYHLMEKLGEGGFGIVWAAEQRHPIKRRVALKIIKLGMDTRQVVARFEAERQTLALMDHPNIARVLDAGATDSGRPYFVMELVTGIPITRYCETYGLSLRERLQLFIQVCQAVQHAHQKGIIHRDLKPSNILVREHEGVSAPKVIDFGIAKATQGRSADQTLFTAVDQLIGTPAYMSPEQLEPNPDGPKDVDTRSDIYSLGVLLYEFLAGTTPFAPKELLARGLDEMRRTIREQEPVRPSTRLRTMQEPELARMARQRQIDPSSLVHLVRGDLDWIVMKCLEKDRTRRYETANGLALDIQRHLAEQPILARPPSAVYQIGKFLRRHRAMVTSVTAVTSTLVVGMIELLHNGRVVSVAVIAAALVLGLLISMREARRAKRAERLQEHSRRLAEAARENEVRQRELAQAQELIACRRAYASEMLAAWQSFLEGDVTRTRDLLERQCPVPGRQVDFRGFEWRYLWAQSRPGELVILSDAPVSVVRYSPNGRLLAAAGEGGVVRLWDAQTQALLTSFRASTDDVASLAFSADNQRLATASRFAPTDKVKFWDLAQAEPHPVVLPGHQQEVDYVAFSRDGTLLLSVGAIPYSKGIPSEVFVWDVPSGRRRFELTVGHDSWVRRADFSPDSEMLATGDGDGVVKIWNLRTKKEIRSLVGHRGFVSCVTFSPKGCLLATADEHGTVIIWDWSTGTVFSVLAAHRVPIYDLAISQDGKWLATACRDHTAKLIEVQTGAELATFRGHSDRVVSVAFARDGQTLATASSSLRLWRAAAREESFVFSPEKSAGTVCFSPDGKWLVQELWNLPQVVVWESGARSKVPDGKILASGGYDRTIRLWETASWRANDLVIESNAGAVTRLAFSPDGITLGIGTFDGPIKLWNLRAQDEVGALRGHASIIKGLAFSPNGRVLASSSYDGVWRLWVAPILAETDATSDSQRSETRADPITGMREII